mgnify:FL=1
MKIWLITLSVFLILPFTMHAEELSKIHFETIDGKSTSLADYKGKVVLLVNTASECGLTPQYRGLQKLYEKHREDGLVILAFPCNDFGKQEPGSLEEIQQFCSANYQVEFPLMAKIHVKGENQHPLYKALTGPEGAFPGDVTWNFGKFLIGQDRKPIARFEPRQKPDDPAITKAVKKALDEE